MQMAKVTYMCLSAGIQSKLTLKSHFTSILRSTQKSLSPLTLPKSAHLYKVPQVILFWGDRDCFFSTTPPWQNFMQCLDTKFKELISVKKELDGARGELSFAIQNFFLPLGQKQVGEMMMIRMWTEMYESSFAQILMELINNSDILISSFSIKYLLMT